MAKSASIIIKITTHNTPVTRYHKCMKQYLQEIFPAEFKRSTAFWRAFVLGLVMLALALFQLFQFEDYPGLIEAMHLPGGAVVATLLAITFPALEILSLPFLFSMRIPKLLRKVSVVAGISVGVLWLIVTIWAASTMGTSVDSGIFGATLSTSSGWWSVVFSALLTWSAYLTIDELPKRRQR